jgi:predicted dehydrogenase
MKKIISISPSRRKFIKNAAAFSAFTIVPRFVLGGQGFVPPSDKITLGMIGTGKQGKGLMRSFLSTEEVQFVAANDVYQAKLDQFLQLEKAYQTEKLGKTKYKGCDGYTNFMELLERDDIDAVVIATPDHSHAAVAVKAAEAGKDIYCEKPLALTIPEGRAMVEATRKHNRVFQTGSMQRSWPEFRQAANLVRNGAIGEIKSIKVSVGGPPVPYDLPKEPLARGLDWEGWLGPNVPIHYNSILAPPIVLDIFPDWRRYKEFGGGGMTDWGAHMFDIAQWAMDMDDSGPVEIIPPNGKEYPHLAYKYANGITMTHENYRPGNSVLFIGTEGEIDVQRRKIETTPAALAEKKMSPSEEKVYHSENHYTDWLNAIRNRTKPICDVEVGHRTASVCTLGNIAYELKKPLQWDPKAEKFTNNDSANKMLTRPMKEEWAALL